MCGLWELPAGLPKRRDTHCVGCDSSDRRQYLYRLRKMHQNLPGRCDYDCATGGCGMKRNWYDYLWAAELLYWALGLCNILFAWLGMFFFFIPLLMALIGGNKVYCNRYCGRGQLLGLLGRRLSRNVPPPRFLRSYWFRGGFLAFFMVMFGLMLRST